MAAIEITRDFFSGSTVTTSGCVPEATERQALQERQGASAGASARRSQSSSEQIRSASSRPAPRGSPQSR